MGRKVGSSRRPTFSQKVTMMLFYFQKTPKIPQNDVKKYRQPPYKNWAAYTYLRGRKLTFFVKAAASFATAHFSIT